MDISENQSELVDKVPQLNSSDKNYNKQTSDFAKIRMQTSV